MSLVADPDTGWQIGGWTGSDDDASTSTPNTVTMPSADHTATVDYVKICYLLTLSHSGSGSDPAATPTSSSDCTTVEYHFGETVTLTASPDSGWEVGSWSGTDDDASTSTVNSLVMPSGAHSAGVAYVEVVGIPDHLVMEGETMSGDHIYEACISITAGPGVEIASGALITFRALSITFMSGFWVNADAEFIADASYPTGCP